MVQFFLPMKKIPTTTHQMKKVMIRNGKPVFYEPPELVEARAKFTAFLSQHVPPEKMTGPLRLVTKWCFPAGKHPNGSWKTTKPDTDNLIKLVKDVMTQLGYWNDDAQVASEVTEKFWAEVPGLFMSVEALDGSCE